MSTPDDATFVVKLRKRVAPFENYMASSWGPKIIGPDAIETHAGKDHGETYLRTHADGTGPFKLTAFERGRQYVLTRNDDYWGDKPFFREVRIKITPDIGSQRLQVVNGDLDAVTHSFPASELESLPDSLKVLKEDSFLQLMLYVNTNKAPFSDAGVRRGLRSTIDVPALVAQAYSGTATPAAGPYPGAAPVRPAARCRYGADAAQAAAAAAKAQHEEDHARVHVRRVGRPAARQRAARGQPREGRLRRDAQGGPAAAGLRLRQRARQGARPPAVDEHARRRAPRPVGADPVLLEGRAELPRLQRQAASTRCSTRRTAPRRPRPTTSTARSGSASSTATGSSSSAPSRTSSSCARTSTASSTCSPTRGRSTTAPLKRGGSSMGGARHQARSSRSSRSSSASRRSSSSCRRRSSPTRRGRSSARARPRRSSRPRRTSSATTSRCRRASPTTWARLASGDLQSSLRTRNPVSEDLAAFAPATIELALSAAVLAAVMGLGLGLAARGRRPGGAGRCGSR